MRHMALFAVFSRSKGLRKIVKYGYHDLFIFLQMTLFVLHSYKQDPNPTHGYIQYLVLHVVYCDE